MLGSFSAVRRWMRSIAPNRQLLKQDALAGIPGAIGSVPDGMAASLLAGVNPIHGLYASFAGPIGGGLTASTRLMVITTTSAAALAAGSALRNVSDADRPGALILLTIMAGALMILAGIFRLGRYTRFVPHSVMIGFLTGVGANIVFGQLPDLTGATAAGSTSIARAFDVITHLGRVHLPSLLVGLGAIAIVSVLASTRLSAVGALLALVIPSTAVAIVGLDRVLRVQDGGDIPRGIPLPALPQLRDLSPGLISGAFAVAALVLVQGAGVSESAPNPDGSAADTNHDFVAQGVGNLAAGFFRGQPVGGSVGQTALNRAAGARTRWASIFSGIWMLVILGALSGVVAKVAMPTLAAVLIFAAIGSFRPGEIMSILRTGTTSRVALVTTFAATLTLPVAQAVGLGVAISLLLQLNRDALDLRVVELHRLPDGRFDEQPAPAVLRSNEVVILDVYGSLLYAGAGTLQARLPDPSGCERPVVVLRLRGRTALGTTFFAVMARYAGQLADLGGRLYVSGVDAGLIERLHRNGMVDTDGAVSIHEAGSIVGASTIAAATEADSWLVEAHRSLEHRQSPPTDEAS